MAYAVANGMFGSIDANRGDPQNGWDTDQFPNSVEDLALPLYEILRGGGFTTGGFNFDAKLRRQSIDRTDLFHAHIGGIDTLARALLVAADMIEGGGRWRRMVDARYAGWDGALGHGDPRRHARASPTSRRRSRRARSTRSRSPGSQELLENVVNRHIWAVDAADRTAGARGRLSHDGPRPRHRRLDHRDQGDPASTSPGAVAASARRTTT